MDRSFFGWPFTVDDDPFWSIHSAPTLTRKRPSNYFHPHPFDWDPFFGQHLQRRRKQRPVNRSTASSERHTPKLLPRDTHHPSPSIDAMDGHFTRRTEQEADHHEHSSSEYTEALTSSDQPQVPSVNEEISAFKQLPFHDYNEDSSDEDSLSSVTDEAETCDDLEEAEIENRLSAIAQVHQKAEQMREKVESFIGEKGSKDYLFIDETLLALIIELDKVDTLGRSVIRQARKTAVLHIQDLQNELEIKATSL